MASREDTAQITVSCATEYPAYKCDEKENCWGLVTLKASKYEPEEFRRPSLDIVAVIDKSGSMQGEKLFLVKKSLIFLVQHLLEKDRLSVITYDTHVSVEFDLLAMDKNHKEFAKSKIQEIHSGSSTNLSGGLLQGLCTILDRGETKNDVASVLLFTDGLANKGICNKNKIIKAMKHPKKYLNKCDKELKRLFPPQLRQYQSNSTPTVSCNSLSCNAGPPSPKPSQHAPAMSSLQRIRKFIDRFTTPTAPPVETSNMPDEAQQEGQANVVDMQQNIAPQEVQQGLQQGTQALQQESEEELEEPAQAIQVQAQPEQAVQQATEVLQQPEQAVQQATEVLQQPEQAVQQATEVLQQPEQAVQQPEQAVQQATEVLQQPEQPVQQATEVLQQPQQAAQQATEVLQQPEPAVQQATEVLQQPEPAVQQATEVLQQPEPAVQQATEVLQQPAEGAHLLAPVQECDKGATEEEKEKIDIDATVYTFGFGTDHDPDMLKAISDAANGMYYFIENEEQISESFGHCFGGLVSTLGQNIKLTLELCDGVTIDAIHGDKSYTSDDRKQKWELQLGDMQSEEERDVLLSLKLPSESSATDILKSSVEYFCLIDSTYKHCEATMSVERSADAEYSPKVANYSIDRQRNRIRTTEATKEALRLADQGDFKAARVRLKEEIKRIKESLTKDDELCKHLIKDMEECLWGLRSHDVYMSSGKKVHTEIFQMHSAQRSNRTSEDDYYENVSQNFYMRKFK